MITYDWIQNKMEWLKSSWKSPLLERWFWMTNLSSHGFIYKRHCSQLKIDLEDRRCMWMQKPWPNTSNWVVCQSETVDLLDQLAPTTILEINLVTSEQLSNALLRIEDASSYRFNLYKNVVFLSYWSCWIKYACICNYTTPFVMCWIWWYKGQSLGRINLVWIQFYF